MSSTVSLRPFRPADLAHVAEICADSCVHDQHPTEMLTGLLRAPRLGTVAVVDGTLIGVCMASLGAAPGPTDAGGGPGVVGFIDLVAVDPTWQGCGVGAQLLANAETRLAKAGCTRVDAAGNAPFYAWPGVDVRYTPAIGLFEDYGYRRRSVEMTMSVDLATAPLNTGVSERDLADLGLAFRPARAEDGPALRAALAPAWKPQWLDEVDATFESPHAGVEVATCPNGYAGFCAYGVNRPGEVGPLGTHPQWRGIGVGTVLIRRALRAVAADGHHKGELPWAGPLSLFARALEATVTRVFVTYTRHLI